MGCAGCQKHKFTQVVILPEFCRQQTENDSSFAKSPLPQTAVREQSSLHSWFLPPGTWADEEPQGLFFALGVRMHERPAVSQLWHIFKRIAATEGDPATMTSSTWEIFTSEVTATFGRFEARVELELGKITERLLASSEGSREGEISWNNVLFELFHRNSFYNITPNTVQRLRTYFNASPSTGYDIALDTAIDLLRSLDDLFSGSIKAEDRALWLQAVREALSTAAENSMAHRVSFLAWLRCVGPGFQRAGNLVTQSFAVPDSNAPLCATHVPHISSFQPNPSERDFVEFLIDGRDMFERAEKLIRNSVREILMCWHLFDMELPCRRGVCIEQQEKSQMINLLHMKAKGGVAIRILLYEPPSADGSFGFPWRHVTAKRTLESLHPNIQVVLHPGIFPLFWTHHQKYVVVDRRLGIIGGIDFCCNRYDFNGQHCHPLFDPGGLNFPGVDYTPMHFQPPAEAWRHPLVDCVKNKNSVPRMPWHDISALVAGLCVKYLVLNFAQRWEHHRRERSDSHAEPFGTVDLDASSSDVWGNTFTDWKLEDYEVQECSGGSMKVLAVRQAPAWAYPRCIGSAIVAEETSNYEALIHTLNKAQRFVYIEAQYIVSSNCNQGPRNRFIEALFQRISAAIDNHHRFFVYIIVPEMVADLEVGRLMRKTLVDGADSIMGRLRAILAVKGSGTVQKLAEDFISICSLRQVERSPESGKWASEQVFVHSKLLIVDDWIVVLGSANFNDRSFVKNRDSEIGIYMEDLERKDDTLGLSPFHVGVHVRRLRLRLWCEHLGLGYGSSETDMIRDPASTEAFELWTKRAQLNTNCIAQAFPTLPKNSITTSSEFKAAKKRVASTELLDSGAYRGTLVDYPGMFLSGNSHKAIRSHFLGVFEATQEIFH